ncbi:MAG: alpha/beta hydrolase [Candidatus Bathyarchaeota archaeon]|nr:alpha/beta hydrolase [Candidatus Bathyarchaeota archaeon]
MLFYTESGPADAPTIIFLPGGGMSGWTWLPQVKRLPDYRCIVPDLPGHGRSPANGPIRIGAAAEEVAELIKDRVPKGRAHVVGLSMGGQTALQLLSAHPELVDRVIVSGTNTSPSGSIRFLAPLLKLTMILYGPLQNTDYMIHANMAQIKISTEYEAEFREDTRLMTPDFYTQVVVESMTYPLPPIADASGLLVACGEKEPELIKKSARMIRGVHPCVPCVVAPGVGHNWGMEKPDLFAAMIRAWVEHAPLPVELNQLP